jgi:hypothetical protein
MLMEGHGRTWKDMEGHAPSPVDKVSAIAASFLQVGFINAISHGLKEIPRKHVVQATESPIGNVTTQQISTGSIS